MESMDKKLKQETSEIRNRYSLHIDKVISFLMENLMFVDVSVPDVVRGKFSEKLKN